MRNRFTNQAWKLMLGLVALVGLTAKAKQVDKPALSPQDQAKVFSNLE